MRISRFLHISLLCLAAVSALLAAAVPALAAGSATADLGLPTVTDTEPPAQEALPEIGGLQLLVNKQHAIGADYCPDDLVLLTDFMSGNSDSRMSAAAAAALKKLVRAAAADGIRDIYAISGYRSYDLQTSLYNNKISYYQGLGYGREEAAELAATSVAPPGTSEHQTGLALDFGTSANSYALNEAFGDTAAGKWLAANAWKYGFILRYPQDKSDITGYIFEPWHFRYVGEPHAEYIYKHDLTLEEYYQQLQQSPLNITTWDGTVYMVELRGSSPDAATEGASISLGYSDTASYLITTRVDKINFADLIGHWSESEVCALIRLGVVNGYPDDTFRPGGHITRSELVALVTVVDQLLSREGDDYRDFDAETFAALFADVYANSWYISQLSHSYQRGLVDHLLVETEDGLHRFFPSRLALRREVAQCLAPLCADLGVDKTVDLVLTDLGSESEAVQQAVETLINYGVIIGRPDGRFYPDDTITRAEVSVMLYRIISCYEQKGRNIVPLDD